MNQILIRSNTELVMNAIVILLNSNGSFLFTLISVDCRPAMLMGENLWTCLFMAYTTRLNPVVVATALGPEPHRCRHRPQPRPSLPLPSTVTTGLGRTCGLITHY
ncbi:hypothetical protein L6452_18043 [Arctium lappa]|uniref:Uncharacterized protein n=1 Tax=Arctium lappa TaxID=4217 RepID=A0ACB9C550_ARCLA|nr:hypothetical protein L6452_18043 [Arctium lappa]